MSLVPFCDPLPSFLLWVHDYCIRDSEVCTFAHSFQCTFVLYSFTHKSEPADTGCLHHFLGQQVAAVHYLLCKEILCFMTGVIEVILALMLQYLVNSNSCSLYLPPSWFCRPQLLPHQLFPLQIKALDLASGLTKWSNNGKAVLECETISLSHITVLWFCYCVIHLLSEFRITEWLRLEGTSGCHLVLPPCSSYEKEHLVHPKQIPAWRWYLISQFMWHGSAIGCIQCRTWDAKTSFLGQQQDNNTEFFVQVYLRSPFHLVRH